MERNKVSEKYTYLILLLTLIFIVSCIVLKIFLFYGFLASIIISFYFFNKNGFSITKLLIMIKKGLFECKSLFVLIALIGAMISIWMTSGVVPTMLYFGLKYMQETNFLFAAFILTSIVSIFMGTAIGTISSVGIALLGLTKIFGIPESILLGAIVSGAFLADRFSPISSIYNLALQTVKVSYRESLPSIAKTLLPTYIISGLIYYFIGRKYSIVLESSNIDSFISAIHTSFIVSPLLLLLPLGIIILSFLGISTLKAVSLGISVGIIVSVGVQKGNFNDILAAIFFGFKANTTSVELNTVLVSGGMVSMVSVLLIVAGAISLSSMFQETALIEPIIRRITSRINSKKVLIVKTGFISMGLTAISDQSVGIILPGKLLGEKYRVLGIESTTLVRTIADTGIIIAPLIPWNANALFIFITTSIPTVAYAPYAVLCYLSPIVTFIFAYLYKTRRP